MTLISVTFVLFLGISLLVYYVLPADRRWISLFAASLFFYLCSGWKHVVFVLSAAAAGYVCMRWIQKLYDEDAAASEAERQEAAKPDDTKRTERKPEKKAGGHATDPAVRRKARRILTVGLAIVIAMLFVSKTDRLWLSAIRTITRGRITLYSLSALGISYYTFALAGYMADVYWKKDRAETGFCRLLLYLIYFPHITQGPIPRHGRLAPQLFAGHAFDYERLCFGLQRMVWGFFKKSVAADRLALVTAAVFSSDTPYPGGICLLAVLCSAFQLYFDFSGCMDIVIGVSECFGITLDENFTRPFFAKSAAEFWRRWHITLGTWFKDYVYLPVSISRLTTELSRRCKDRFGRKAARNVMTVVPLAVVWLLTGLWHGTGADYILWGCYWGTIIICSTVFAKQIKDLDKKLSIDPAGRGWQRWQMVRTFLIFCGGRALTAPGSLRQSAGMMKRVFTAFGFSAFTDGTLQTLGLDFANFLVLLIAFIMIAAVDILNERGVNIRRRIAALPLALRWFLYYLLIMSVIILGKYGAAYDSSAFIYAGF